MDRGQFDVLARLVSSKQSRRTALIALVGAAVLGRDPAATLGVDPAATPGPAGFGGGPPPPG